VQEREVRLTAQRLLTHHLRPGRDKENPIEPFWGPYELDLTGALLIDFDFIGRTASAASFAEAAFVGIAYLDEATFTGVRQLPGRHVHQRRLLHDNPVRDLGSLRWCLVPGPRVVRRGAVRRRRLR
jgi:hypothetical protein